MGPKRNLIDYDLSSFTRGQGGLPETWCLVFESAYSGAELASVYHAAAIPQLTIVVHGLLHVSCMAFT